MNGSKSRRGGARPGAGRPRGGGKSYSFRLTSPLARQLDAQPNKTQFIRDSIGHELEARAAQQSASIQTAQQLTAQQQAAQQQANSQQPGHAAGLQGSAVSATQVNPLHLPFFDVRVAAGFPIPLDNDERSQDIDMLRLLCPHPEASYLIRVNGDSMIDAGVLSGDIVIVDKSRRDPSPKEIAVCELNGEYTLKHFVREGGRGWLVPANPAYPRIPIADCDAFSVWGTVTYIIHKARD